MKFIAAPLLKTFGFRSTLLVNGLASCCLMAAIGFFTQATPLILIFGVLFCTGLLRSLQFTSFNSIAYSDIETSDVGRANGLYTVMQQLSMAMGVAVAAMTLDLAQIWRGATELGQSDYAMAFYVIAAFAFLGLPSLLLLKPNAGSSTSGHRLRD
jgi:fucose permease